MKSLEDHATASDIGCVPATQRRFQEGLCLLHTGQNVRREGFSARGGRRRHHRRRSWRFGYGSRLVVGMWEGLQRQGKAEFPY